MTPFLLAILLLAVGLIFVVAELIVPSHGMLALTGGAGIVAAIGVCFLISTWAGLGAVTAGVLLLPFLGIWFVHIWPRTPIGRRLTLQPIPGARTEIPVSIGTTGRAISELRPSGLCEFGELRLQAISEHGIIAVGQAVRVVAVSDDRPTVRAI